MRHKSPYSTFSRRDALRFALGASALHAPLWLGSCMGRPGSDDRFDREGTGTGAGLAAPGDDPVPTAPYDPEVSWYLQNEYAPTQEEHDIFQLEVIGSIPPELEGVYFRNGPNLRGADKGHKFFGQGMVHAVALGAGRALWYRNRYVRCPAYEEPDTIDPDPKWAGGNTSLIYQASRLLAVSEAGLPYEMSPSDLQTIGPYDFAGKLADYFTGHPKLDPATGEMFAYGSMFLPPFLRYYRIDRSGNMVSNEPIDLPLRRDGLGSKMLMMHDFAITATKTVFMHLPLVLDVGRALQGQLPYGWDESNGSHLGILPRDGGSSDIVWIEIDPCWIFHTVNAYDDGPTRVILDVSRHPAPFWDGDNAHFYPATPNWRATRSTSKRAPRS